jgi:hypothetical protein
MELFIKHMVSLRCRMVVQEELKKLGLRYVNIDLGKVEILTNNSPTARAVKIAACVGPGISG